MKSLALHKITFLGFIIVFMNLGKIWDYDVVISKNNALNINYFSCKSTADNHLLGIQTDLEYDESQSFQQSDSSSDNTIQHFDLLFRFNNFLLKKIALSHFLLYFPTKKYLLNCIFLI